MRNLKNIKKNLRMKAIKELESKEVLASIKFKWSLQRWKLRVETTKRIRFNVLTMKNNHAWRIKKAIWEAFLHE